MLDRHSLGDRQRLAGGEIRIVALEQEFRAALGTKGPMSLITRRPIGDFGWAARLMPISPPMEVPTQSTRSTSRRAIRAAASAQYCGRA